MKFYPFERCLRYIRRHPSFSLTESNRENASVQTWTRDQFTRPAGLPARLDFARAFNWARERGLNDSRKKGVPRAV